MKSKKLNLLILPASLLMAGLSSAATTISFQDGTNSYTGTQDTSIVTWVPGGNFGGRVSMEVRGGTTNRARSLIRYDLSSLSGQIDTVDSVILRLEFTTLLPGRTGTVQLYRLADANVGWVEGTKNGTVAAGESTWNHRNHNTTTWAGSGGASTAGTDYHTLLASFNYISGSSGTVDFNLSGDLSFIKDWANGGTNAGFFLRDAAESAGGDRIYGFHTRESLTVGFRPELIVTYTVPEPGSLALLGLGGLLLASRRRRV